MRPAYEAVLTGVSFGHATRYLDVGYGTGLAAQLAAARVA